MRVSELDDIEKKALLGKVVEPEIRGVKKMSVNENQNLGAAVEDRKTETPLDAFRRSAGFQIMFVLHSGLEVGRAIEHLCTAAEKYGAALREWQPIETCPDNTTVLFWNHGPRIGRMEHNCLRMDNTRQDHFWGDEFDDDDPPTYWMPLREPPCLSISVLGTNGQA